MNDIYQELIDALRAKYFYSHYYDERMRDVYDMDRLGYEAAIMKCCKLEFERGQRYSLFPIAHTKPWLAIKKKEKSDG